MRYGGRRMSRPKNLAIPVLMVISLLILAWPGEVPASPAGMGDQLSVSGIMADAQGKGVKEVGIELLLNGQKVTPLGREDHLETGSKGGFVGGYRLPKGTLPEARVQIRAVKPSWQTQESQDLKVLDAGTDEGGNPLFQAQGNLSLKRRITPAFLMATIVLLLVYVLIA